MLGAPLPGVQERLTHLGTLLDSGIALKRRIIETQGGRLRVTSRPGEGTLVEATLPAQPLAA
jgi:signal transduction histidine kinase